MDSAKLGDGSGKMLTTPAVETVGVGIPGMLVDFFSVLYVDAKAGINRAKGCSRSSL
jgi:hypothetical protein